MRVMRETCTGTVCSIAVAFYIIWYKAAHLFLTHTHSIPVLNAERPEVGTKWDLWTYGEYTQEYGTLLFLLVTPTHPSTKDRFWMNIL